MVKNLRRFTALLPKGFNKYLNGKQIVFHLRSFLFVLFVLLAGILIQSLSELNKDLALARQQYSVKNHDYVYWSSVASQFPTIPDILYNAAVSSYNIGNKNEAISYLDKAMQLDPLFTKARDFKKEIVGM